MRQEERKHPTGLPCTPVRGPCSLLRSIYTTKPNAEAQGIAENAEREHSNTPLRPRDSLRLCVKIMTEIFPREGEQGPVRVCPTLTLNHYERKSCINKLFSPAFYTIEINGTRQERTSSLFD